MASVFSRLFKDTAIYGISSVIGRFLNWLLVILYSNFMFEETLGRMTNLYSWIVILMVILTYGMETAFFRYSSTHERPNQVFATGLISIGVSTSVFVLLGLLLQGYFVPFFHLEQTPLILTLFILIIALDTFTALPLAYLRYSKRPWRFMAVRMSFVLITIVLTLFAFLGLPFLAKYYPALAPYAKPEFALYYVMGINLIGNICQLAMLSPTIMKAEGGFDPALWKKMFVYALPILMLGLVASFSNQADKMIFPELFDDPKEGDALLGVYSMGYKIAVVLVMFTQAFRYAYEPFVFAKAKDGEKEAKNAYALSMRYYVLVALTIFLGVMSFLDLIALIIPDRYIAGFQVIPWIMTAQLMLGIYLNLSLWYKLKDMTYWGAIISVIGTTISLLIIIFGAVPYGFMACAWAAVASSGVMMLISYFLGQRYYPIQYPIKAIAFYSICLAFCLFVEDTFTTHIAGDNIFLRQGFNALIFLAFLTLIIWREVPKATLEQFLKKAKALL